MNQHRKALGKPWARGQPAPPSPLCTVSPEPCGPARLEARNLGAGVAGCRAEAATEGLKQERRQGCAKNDVLLFDVILIPFQGHLISFTR